MKCIKLYCDNHHCDTEFFISIKVDEGVNEYYICPICEALVRTEDIGNYTDNINALKTEALLNNEGLHITYTAENGLEYNLKQLDDVYFINILKEKGYHIIKMF